MINSSQPSPMTNLLEFLQRLEKDKIVYRLEHSRTQSINVVVNIPGYRWEVEFFDDGEVEIEIFISTGVKGADEQLLDRLLKEQEDMDRNSESDQG